MMVKPLSHAGLKILSFAMAIFLWMIVAGEETVERGLLPHDSAADVVKRVGLGTQTELARY